MPDWKPLASRRRAFLNRYHRYHDDVALAEAMRTTPASVRSMLQREGLERNQGGLDRSGTQQNDALPPLRYQLPPPICVRYLNAGDYLVACLSVLVTLGLYLLTLPPTVTGEDSGELIAAAYTLGIPHPPGYPGWCLIAHAFTYIPFGTVAWRVALMSSVFGALTAGIVALLSIKLSRSRLAGLVAALALAFSGEFWEQAVIAEVYTLNAFFVALSLLLLLLWYESRRPSSLLWLGLTFGLGLTNHNTMVLLGPVIVATCLFIEPVFWRRWRLYAGCTALALLALGVYAYMPIRSAANPPVDWGNPETLGKLWESVTRQQYRQGEASPRSLFRLGLQTLAFLRLYAHEFTPWVGWLALPGLWVLWKRDRFGFGLLLFAGGVLTLSFLLGLNFDLDRQSVWISNVFWIPAYLLAAILVGVAVGAVGQRTGWTRHMALLLAAVCCASPLIAHYGRNDKSAYYFTRDYALNILSSMEQDAIYFPTADHATFPAMYLQVVEGVRPDVTIGDKYGYPEPSLYESMPFESKPAFEIVPSRQQIETIVRWIVAHTERPVYFTSPKGMGALPGHELVQEGLVYRVVRPDEEYLPGQPWGAYTWHTLDPASTHGELTADYVLSDYYSARARAYLGEEQVAQAMAQFGVAAGLARGDATALNNIGSACAEFGLLREAEAFFRDAVEADPQYATALRNLGKVLLAQERHEEALLAFEQAVGINPRDAESLELSISCMEAIGWYDDAIKRLEYLAQLKPLDASVLRHLGSIYLREKGDQATANHYFRRANELQPAPAGQQPPAGQQGQSPLALPPLDARSLLPTNPMGPALPVPSAPTPTPGGLQNVQGP